MASDTSLADVTADVEDTSRVTEKKDLETMLRGTLPSLKQPRPNPVLLRKHSSTLESV